jgi:hypothetical protein
MRTILLRLIIALTSYNYSRLNQGPGVDDRA